MSTRISKFLSLVLRHEPARIGITLDDAGWTDIDALLEASGAHGVPITRSELAAIVASSDKQRFALSADGQRIRANQGHSIDVDLQLAPATPPPRLFHGTVAAVLPAIRAQGLLRGQRHHVHLSADLETATRVGSRRGTPVLLTIRADDMAAAGHVFYRSNNGVWLVDHVPPAFLEPEPAPAATAGDRAAHIAPARAGRGPDHLRRIAIAEQTLAALDAGRYVNAHHEIVDIGVAVQAAVEGTVLHTLGAPLRPPGRGATTAITVRDESTLEAVTRLAASPIGHLACLNFASAIHPGGGFLRGAQAQEETLARSSALYPCLQRVPEHYQQNQRDGSAYYLDLAVFSPHVPVLCDDAGRWLDRPVHASIVTCAAPNASALRQRGALDAGALEATLRRRAALVLAVAAHHGVTRLVLGAWGAGVFGNDPLIVADAFGTLLDGPFAGAFAEAIFAIPGAGGPNHDAFAARFPASGN